MEAPSDIVSDLKTRKTPVNYLTKELEEAPGTIQSDEIPNDTTKLAIVSLLEKQEQSPTPVKSKFTADNKNKDFKKTANFKGPARSVHNLRTRHPSYRPHNYGGEWIHPLNSHLLSSVRQGYRAPTPPTMVPSLPPAPWLPMAPCLPPAPWLPMAPCLPQTTWLAPAPWWPTGHSLPPVSWWQTAPWLPSSSCSTMAPWLPSFVPPASVYWPPAFAPQPVPTRLSSQLKGTSSAPPYSSLVNPFPPPPYSTFFINTPPPSYSSASLNPGASTYFSPSLNSPPPAYSPPSSHLMYPVATSYSSPTLNRASKPHASYPLNPAAPPYPSSPTISPLTTPPSDPWIPSAETVPAAEPPLFTNAPFSEDPMFSTVWRPLAAELLMTRKLKSDTSCGGNGDSNPLREYQGGAVWSIKS